MKSGENMLTLVRATQLLHSEIAALLKTFEKLAADHGYVNGKDRSVSNGCSYSIDSPDEWMMPWMFRFMVKKGNPDDVLQLNVVLTPREDEGRADMEFTEPLVLSARFRFTKGKAKEHAGEWDAWELWFSGPRKELKRVYKRDQLALDDKSFREQSGWSDASVNAIQELNFMALPLADISNSKILDSEIVRRILA